MFPRIYEDRKPDLPGYESFSFRLLVNPTGAEKNDWIFGYFGDSDCAECAKLEGGKASHPSERTAYCTNCTKVRNRLANATHAIYCESRVQGLDFSTPEAALASLEQTDLPDELLGWLLDAPRAIWNCRADDMKKKLTSPLVTGNS